MRHNVFGRKLNRSMDGRRALFKGLVYELVMHGRVKTTKAKAKAVKPLVDKLVTKAKKSTLAARRDVMRMLPKDAAGMFLDTITPRFVDRTSGFSKIVQLGERMGDNAPMVLLEWVDYGEIKDQKSKIKNDEGKTKTRKSKLEEKKPVRKARKKNV